MIEITPMISAVRQAVTLCQQVQKRHIATAEKTAADPVTIADYGSQAIICRTIQETCPGHAVMAEESGQQFLDLVADEHRAEVTQLITDVLQTAISEEEVTHWLDYGTDQKSEWMWVIDPIDGTKGFLSQRQYAIAVALMHNRQPVAGVLAAPEYPGGGKIFYCVDNAAFSVPIHGGDPTEIRVSSVIDPAQIRALESFEKSHASFDRMAVVRNNAGLLEENIERMDSQEKYARLANGDAELFLRLPQRNSTRKHSIWDHAAGAVIVEAAGGTVTDVDGSPLNYSEGTTLKNHGVVASNGPLHDQLIDAVQKMMAEEPQS